MNCRIVEYDQVPSTNGIVRDAIKAGEHEILVVCARSQSEGQGRRGNIWGSPEGGVYMSLLLEPRKQVSQISTLGMAVAAGVCDLVNDLIAEHTVARAMVKWPNDVVISSPAHSEGFYKICGISTDLVGGKVCLGIGLNVLAPPKGRAAEGKNMPVYLADLVGLSACVSVEDVRRMLIESAIESYRSWDETPFSELAPYINMLSYLNGCEVEVSVGSDHLQGRFQSDIVAGLAERIADDGSLVVGDAASGGLRNIYEGSVRLKPVVHG